MTTQWHRLARSAWLATSLASALAATLAIAFSGSARAQSTLSEASAASTLPIAVSIAGTGLLLSAGTTLSIVAVQLSTDGITYVLERASDGSRSTLRLSGQTAGALSLAAGTPVVVSLLATGAILSAAGRAFAFVPNEVGAALLYSERITR